MKKVNLEFTDIPSHVPDIQYYIDKIDNGEVFNFMRMNHAFIDAFRYAYKNWDTLETHFEEKKYKEIAGYVANVYKQKHLGLGNWHKYSDTQERYIRNLLRMTFEYKTLKPRVQIGISLGVGLGTYWGIWQENHHVQQARKHFAEILTRVTGETFFYAGIIKHYTIKREWDRLFDALNKNNFNVVFLGPKPFDEYDKIFNINNFNYIEIPRVGAIDKIDEYIDNIKTIDSTSDNPTIVFYMTGHILSAKIVKDILDTNIYSMDIGRGFDLLMKEKFADGDVAYQCWTGLDEVGMNQYVDDLRK